MTLVRWIVGLLSALILGLTAAGWMWEPVDRELSVTIHE